MPISFMCFWEHVEEGILDTSQMYNLYFIFVPKQKVRESCVQRVIAKIASQQQVMGKQERDSVIKNNYYLFVHIVCNHSQHWKN